MGFLFDVKNRGEYFFVFVLEKGQMEIIPWKYALPVYIRGQETLLVRMGKKLKKMGLVESFRFDEKIDYLSGRKVRVLRLDTFRYQSLSRYLERYGRGFEIFNTGIPP